MTNFKQQQQASKLFVIIQRDRKKHWCKRIKVDQSLEQHCRTLIDAWQLNGKS
jgi:hypothetical protein